MLRKEGLQVPDPGLNRFAAGVLILHFPQPSKEVHDLPAQSVALRFGTAFFLLFILLVGIRFAPHSLSLGTVIIDLAYIKSAEFQVIHSHHVYSPCQVHQILQMGLPGLQKSDLLFQYPVPVKIRCVQDSPNLLQGKPDLPEEQDEIPFQCGIIVEPVARLRHPGRLQQANGVIVVERAHTHTSLFRNLRYGFHSVPSCHFGLYAMT